MPQDCISSEQDSNYLAEAFLQLQTEFSWFDEKIMTCNMYFMVLERASFIEQSRKVVTMPQKVVIMTQQEFCKKWRDDWVPTSAARIFWTRAFNEKYEKLLEMSKDFLNTEGSHGNMSYDLANRIVNESSRSKSGSSESNSSR